VILERSDRVGGTWRDTSYPGASCDIPSLLYSFSFVKNPTWSRTYSPADEIREHIEDMATRFDIRRHIQFGQEVTGLSLWTRMRGVDRQPRPIASVFGPAPSVLASGPLPDSSFPDIRGIDTYRGHKIHSARWDQDYDFAGKRVGVIGTGASAIQIIPETGEAGRLRQSLPAHPRLGAALVWDIATPPAVQSVFAKAPAVQQLARQALYWGHEASATALVWNTPLTSVVARLGRMHLRRQVKDRGLRRQLTPDFTPGCKRMLVSSDYYTRPAARQLQAHRPGRSRR